MWWQFAFLYGSLLALFAIFMYWRSRHDVNKTMFYALLIMIGIVIMLAGAATGLYLQG